jgi:hypothetical protein
VACPLRGFLLVSFLLCLTSTAQAVCRLEAAQKLTAVPLSAQESAYTEVRRKLCRAHSRSTFDDWFDSAGIYHRGEFSTLFGTHLPYHVAGDAVRDQVFDIVEILSRGPDAGAPVDRATLFERLQKIVVEAAYRLAQHKPDPFRGMLNKIPFAPGICEVKTNCCRKGDACPVYCDENFTIDVMRALASSLQVLSSHGKPEVAKWVLSKLEQIDAFYIEHQWKPIDSRTPTLEYLCETNLAKAAQPMHNNGLSEYGLYLLTIERFYREVLGNTSIAMTYETKIKQILNYVLGTVEEAIAPDEAGAIYCVWRYRATDPAKMDDAGHGTAILRFLLAIEENLRERQVADLPSKDYLSAIASTYFRHGYMGTGPGGFLKEEVKPGNTKCYPPESCETIGSRCRRDLEIFRIYPQALHNICASVSDVTSDASCFDGSYYMD